MTAPVRVLGIETSCDETAAAVVEDGRRVLSDVVSTQIEIHRRWGGVVPELASRNHVVQVMPVIDEALARAGGPAAVDAIAVTSGPGLVGALLVGVQVAKALALAWEKPLVGVNHLEGHLLAAFLGEAPPALPLPRPGGLGRPHLALRGARLRRLPAARPDPRRRRRRGLRQGGQAARACPTRAAWPSTGWPATGDRRAIRFPRAIVKGADLDFSFTGLKTALLHHVRKHGVPEGQGLADLCASYQEAIVGALVHKAFRRRAPLPAAAAGAGRRRGRQQPAARRGAGAGGRVRGPPGASSRRCGSAPTTPP